MSRQCANSFVSALHFAQSSASQKLPVEYDTPDDNGYDDDTSSLMTSNRPLARPSGLRPKSKSPMIPNMVKPMTTSGGMSPMASTMTVTAYGDGERVPPKQTGIRGPHRESSSTSYPLYQHQQTTVPPQQPNVSQPVPQTAAVPMNGYILISPNVVNGATQIPNVGNGASLIPVSFGPNQPQALMMTNSFQRKFEKLTIQTLGNR